MVTTRSGACSSANHVATPGRQSNPEPPFNPDTPPRKKRARKSKAHKKKDFEEIPRSYGLMDMPDEIFAEIFSGVQPGDLLTLSVTCKLFRNTLMKKSAVNIWKFAEGNVPHLPAYPWFNMTPPAYAALLFSKSCTSCGTHTSAESDPYLLVRLCPNCREEDLVEIGKRDPDTKLFYKIVVKTNRIRLTSKKKERRPRGLGPQEYCLRQELKSVKDAYQNLLRADCNAALQRWKVELQEEVTLRNQFSLRLQKFMRKTNHDRALESESKVGERRAEILRRLRELGWKDGEFEMGYNKEWDALVNQPRPLTDRVWTNLLPKLTPLLEAKRASIELTAKQERRTTRIDRLTTLLQAFMIKAHPLASLVEALGFNPELRGTDSNEVSQHVVKFLENCPFPDVQTVSKWPWIADTIETEVTLQEIDNLFCANLVDIDDRAFHWRRDIEKQLLIPILSERTQSNELDPDDLNSEVIFKLTVKGSAPPLKTIGPLTRFLLRADTIFRQIREDPKINEEFVYYPYLTSTFGSYYWVDDELLKVTPSSYHRHELAEKVSRALLKGIEMVDASHLELAVMGDVFVCGRCRLQKAKSWQGMVQHYLDELRSWSVSLLVYPRFKTRHPTGYYNAHSITCSIDNSPLTRVATDQEVTEMNMESAQLDNPISCIPCKNYARMYVSTNMEAMECHLERAHLLSLPVAEGVHYEPVTGSTNFLQGGGEWKVRWDAYYDEHAD